MAVFTKADRVALYTHLRTFESDFDKSQSQMRAISSAWTGAVLAALALLITTAATPIAVPQGGTLKPDGLIDFRADALAYLRAVICFLGSAGVLAFWYVDQGIYQRLLHSAFAYGLFAEANEPELPQVRSAMFLANLDVTNRLGIFYRAQYYLFVVISIVIYWSSGLIAHNPNNVVYVIVLHFILAIVCDLIFSHIWPSLDDTIRDFYPELAEALPSRTHKNRGEPQRFDKSTDPRMPAFLKRIRHQAHQQST